ncbi:MAG: M1 family peptidase [Gammaproteobacteria bacterium]|nr:M1 family peptidase [Gammaproteobacteria bacterium]
MDPYRLPEIAFPSRYDITLRPDLDAATFSGTETIRVTVGEPTDEIVLNAIEIEIEEATLGNRSLSASYEPETERVRLSDGAQIPAGEHTLSLRFSGILNDKLHGFYRSTFTDADGRDRVIATTQFEATDARRAFPCWDEPGYKAVFGITLDVPEGLLAVSNGAESSRTRLDDGTIRITFSDTPRMSTYLVAFVVGPFVATEPVDADGVPLRVIHQAGQEQLAEFALEAGAHYLQWLADYYGIPYQGDKMDLIAIPDFAFGAMENLGAVTFRENALLVDLETASHAEIRRVSEVIAHELAHMWFGDYVTMKWWNGIWLNEAFATFMEMIAQDAWKPEWKTWLSFAPARSQSMVTDALQATRPVEFPVVAPYEADEMFDVLTYLKGSSLVRMLQQFLGEEVFRKGVKAYLEAHAFANSETSDLWAALELASGQPVGSVMESWIFSGGYPQVEVSLNGNSIVARQRRFQYRPTGDGDLWQIPLTLAYGAGDAARRTDVVFTTPEIRVDVEGPVKWVLANVGGHGYYRSHYSRDLLDRLLDRLDRLSALERHGLIDDAWACVIAGQTDIATYLDLLTHFGNETEYAVWTAIVESINQIHHTFDRSTAFERYVRDLLTPAVERLGWDPRPEEDSPTRRLRGLLISALGRYGQDSQVRTRAVELLPAVLGHTLDPEVARAVITVTANAGLADYDTFLSEYEHAQTPQDKNRYLHALPLFPDRALAERTFAMALDGRIKTQDAPFVVEQLLASRTAGRTAWNLYTHRWDEQVRVFPPMLLKRTLGTLWTLSNAADEVHAFFDGRTVHHAEKALAQELERLDVMAAFRERAGEQLAAYLAE